MGRSLQNRLLFFLSLLAALVALIQASIVYHQTLNEINTILDEQLQRLAHSLAGSAAVLRHNNDFPFINEDASLVIQSWSIDGQIIYRSSPELAPPPFTTLGFSQHNGYKNYAIRTRYQVLQVSQPIELRTHKASTIAIQTIIPIVLLASLFLVAVLLVVYWSLRPLKKLRKEVALRSVDQLSPLNTQNVPLELYPLLNEFNHLIARIQTSYQFQKQFVGDAAHELRTPLTGLQLQIQALQTTDLNEEQTLYVQRLAFAVHRNIELVEQLLTLAQTEQSLPQVQEVVNFQQIVDSVLKELNVWSPEGLPAIITMLNPTPTVMGEPAALQILIRNLLKNAIQHIPKEGTIHLSLLAEASDVVLQIEDSGPGIPESERQNVLQRFYRLQPKHTGSGLGLAIVDSIAKRHRAKMVLDASPTLLGLRIRIFFPSSTLP